MSRFALVVCASVCALLAIANAEFWHVEGWMPLGAAAALAFVFVLAERGRRGPAPVLIEAPRQTGEGWPESSFALDADDEFGTDVPGLHGAPVLATEDSR